MRRLLLVAVGFLVMGFFSFGCKSENPSGHDNTPLPCNHVYDSLVIMSSAQYGFAPMGPAIALDSLRKLVITSSTVQPLDHPAYPYGRPMDAIGKIIFK